MCLMEYDFNFQSLNSRDEKIVNINREDMMKILIIMNIMDMMKFLV